MKSKFSFRINISALLIIFSACSFLLNVTFSFPLNEKKVINSLSSANYDLKPDLPAELSPEAKGIKVQMDKIKEENFVNAGDILLQLQKKLELSGSPTITKQEESFGSVISNLDIKKFNHDNFSLTEIYRGNLVKGVASQVQQRYSGEGTVWVAVGAGTPDTGISVSGDTLIVYRSIDNTGTSFSEFTRVYIGSANKFYPEDAIDMEIIELNNLTSYIYIVYNYTTNGYNGNQKTACTVIRSNPSLVNNFMLNFPGSTSLSNNYFRPRITSDIATYYVSPYVTIALVQDSAVGNSHYYLTKYCRIVNPFTTNPSVTYLPKSIYVPLAVPKDFSFTIQSDISYVNTGGSPSGKIIFALSGYPTASSNIYIYKTDAVSVSYPIWSDQLTISPASDVEFFRIASNGGAGQNLVKAVFSVYDSSGIWQSGIFESNITDANDSWSGNITSNTYGDSRNGDIIGKRNASGSFSYAFKRIFGCAFANNEYIMQRAGTSEMKILSLNYEYSNSHAAPKPVFRYENNDSALCISTGYYYVNSRSGNSKPLVLDLKINIQGLYNTSTDLNNWDDRIYVYLANPNFPFNIIDSATNFLCSNDNSGSFVFHNAPQGNYYFVIKHRNSLEAWSAGTVNLNSDFEEVSDFRFSDAAYGNNLIQVNSFPDRFALYSGDVNQDGIIDASDVSNIDNDAFAGITGNNVNDLTGDSFVDAQDVSIADNNAYNSVSVIKP